MFQDGKAVSDGHQPCDHGHVFIFEVCCNGLTGHLAKSRKTFKDRYLNWFLLVPKFTRVSCILRSLGPCLTCYRVFSSLWSVKTWRRWLSQSIQSICFLDQKVISNCQNKDKTGKPEFNFRGPRRTIWTIAPTTCVRELHLQSWPSWF